MVRHPGPVITGSNASRAAVRHSELELQDLPGHKVAQLAAAADAAGRETAGSAADPDRVVRDAPQDVVAQFNAGEATLDQVDGAGHRREMDSLGRCAALDVSYIAAGPKPTRGPRR